MPSRTKRMRASIKGTNERYFYGVLVSLCKQKLSVRIGWALDIIFKRWKEDGRYGKGI